MKNHDKLKTQHNWKNPLVFYSLQNSKNNETNKISKKKKLRT